MVNMVIGRSLEIKPDVVLETTSDAVEGAVLRLQMQIRVVHGVPTGSTVGSKEPTHFGFG